MEAPQSQVVAPPDEDTHRPLGLESTESVAVEDRQSAGASMSTPTPSVPALDMATMSTQLAEEEEDVPVTRPSTQL